MATQYEYKFVRLGKGWLGVSRAAEKTYRQVIQEHAEQGWRLVQVFAPGNGPYGSATYYEAIFEREAGGLSP